MGTERTRSIDENVYIKDGRRYIPFGRTCQREWLSDGIWLVKHRPGVRAITNMGYLADAYGVSKIGDITGVDFPLLGGLEDVSEFISKTIIDFQDTCKKENKGWSIMDISRAVAIAMHRKYGAPQEEETDSPEGAPVSL